MTDTRPEITVHAEPPFVVFRITETVLGSVPMVKEIPLSIDEAQQLLSGFWAKCNVVATILEARLKVLAEVCGKEDRPESDWVGKIFDENCKKLQDPKQEHNRSEEWRSLGPGIPMTNQQIQDMICSKLDSGEPKPPCEHKFFSADVELGDDSASWFKLTVRCIGCGHTEERTGKSYNAKQLMQAVTDSNFNAACEVISNEEPKQETWRDRAKKEPML